MQASSFLQSQLERYDLQIKNCISEPSLKIPQYSPATHYIDLTNDKYYLALIALRQALKMTSDVFFTVIQRAYCIDLFMYTSSISSPIGPGSDSEAIPFKFGNLDTFLVDSSQFGFEPLLMNGIDKVYCYLPSMRGETPNARHLNQFFHCESEIVGDLSSAIKLSEQYFQSLSNTLLLLPNIFQKMNYRYSVAEKCLNKILKLKSFPTITFDDAVKQLEKHNYQTLINYHNNGRDLSSRAEIKLASIINYKVPFWITNYDRDRVPFYQKPDPTNNNKVPCADLIVPPLFSDSFGGEVLGAGQRQDNPSEMYESLSRQGILPNAYDWYINLRNLPNYKTTSGFGLGIERFISWALGLDNIREAIIYPRQKNILSFP